MRKFEKKINELGLEKGKLSKNLNEVIRNFELAEDELKSLKIELKNAEKEEDNEEEIDNLVSKIEETESQLEQTDDYLVKKIEIHHKNGDMYAMRAEKMREARIAKSANKNSTTEAQPQVTQATPLVKNEEVKEKKKTNLILWGVLGVAGIFVGINLFKNKR